MCVVQLGYQNFLLTAATGLKVVQLMQEAVKVEHNFMSRDDYYLVGDQAEVEYRAVRLHQLRAKPGSSPEAPSAPLLLER